MRRLRLLILTLSSLTSACGGMEVADETMDSALRDRGQSLSVADAVFGGTTTITFYPGEYAASSALFVQLECTQNGVTVLKTGSPNYKAYSCDWLPRFGVTCVGDHYETVVGSLESSAYTGGAADCVVTASASDGRHVRPIATARFHISP